MVKWTQEEINYLKNNFKNKSNIQLAEEMSRPKGSITKKAWELGLKKLGLIWMKIIS